MVDAPAARDSFCVIPFTQLIVRADGGAQVCNRFASRVNREGRPMSVRRHTVGEMWNCVELRDIRRAMVEGRPVPACRQCYAEEDAGAVSLRQHTNQAWRDGFLNEEGRSEAELLEWAAARDFRAGLAPRFVQLDVSSRCNLACRMCNSGASSRVNRDPVLRRWSGPSLDLVADPELWFKRPSVVRDVLSRAHEIRQLHVIGGEPFLIDEVETVLRTVVEAGAAGHIELSMHTNATTTRARWLPLTERFARVVFYVSVDGVGEVYEYIRYPARWSRFVANLAVLQGLPNVEVRAHVVVQNTNVLGIVRLFEFLDEAGVPISALLLDHPAYLRATVAPRAARELAARRLRVYLGSGCREAARESIGGIANFLENASDPDAATLREFVLFTNDLDRSRGQRFDAANAELAALWRDAGIPWPSDTRYAGNEGHVGSPTDRSLSETS